MIPDWAWKKAQRVIGHGEFPGLERRLATALAEEREGCAKAIEELGEELAATKEAATFAAAIRNRSD